MCVLPRPREESGSGGALVHPPGRPPHPEACPRPLRLLLDPRLCIEVPSPQPRHRPVQLAATAQSVSPRFSLALLPRSSLPAEPLWQQQQLMWCPVSERHIASSGFILSKGRKKKKKFLGRARGPLACRALFVSPVVHQCPTKAFAQCTHKRKRSKRTHM